MSDLPTQRPITTEMVMRVEVMKDEYKLIEVVNGEWLNPSWIGAYYSIVTSAVLFHVGQYVQAHDLGFVYPPGLAYVLAGNRTNIRTLRKASVSFVSKARRYSGYDYYYKPPDLAVETVAPQKPQIYRDAKIADWLRAGTKQVWAVDRDNGQVHVHLSNGTSRTYNADDTLPGGDVLPGFKVQVAEIFDV